MSKVVMQTIVSVDGFIATDDDQVGPLFDWFGTGDTPLYDDGPLVTARSYDYFGRCWTPSARWSSAGTSST